MRQAGHRAVDSAAGDTGPAYSRDRELRTRDEHSGYMHRALVLLTHRVQCARPVTSLYRRNAACDLKLIAYVFRFAFWCAEFDTRKTVAVRIIEAIVKSGQVLDTIDSVDKLFTIIAPVLKDQVRVVHRAC